MTAARTFFLSLASAFLAFWAFGFWAFGMNWSALLLFSSAVLWSPFGWEYRKKRVFSLLIGVLMALLFVWLPFVEYDRRVVELSAKLDNGPAAFSFRDKLGIYGLNGVMGGAGAVLGFPEVAIETLYLALPGPKTRVFESDFPLASPKVRKAVAKRIKSGRAGTQNITWTYDTHESLRAGLALNSMLLKGEPVGDDWQFTGVVEISYPHRYRLVLAQVAGHTFQIEEGLFGMLEQAGWLHPYDAEWTWTMTVDDPRLADLTTPRRSWLE